MSERRKFNEHHGLKPNSFVETYKSKDIQVVNKNNAFEWLSLNLPNNPR